MTSTDTPVWAEDTANIQWVLYQDPHLPSGEHAAQVQIIRDNLFKAYFPPGFSAPAHAHPHDTTYYVLSGRIRFGNEGWFGPGSARGVTAGHVYGPEEADPDEGVVFLLFSTGPIAIDWQA